MSLSSDIAQLRKVSKKIKTKSELQEEVKASVEMPVAQKRQIINSN
jgi:hypothetical protein